MALRVSSTMALCLLLSLIAVVAHCVPLEADLATNDASIAIPAAKVHAVPGEQEILHLPSSDDSVVSDAVTHEEEVPGEEDAAMPVAEPDPDRSHPDSDGEEELAAKKPSLEDDEDEDEEEEEKKKTRKDHDEKKKRKKRHGCDGKGEKQKKTKKHHQSNDEEEEKEMKTKKQIHRHHRVEEEKTKKQPDHSRKKNNSGDEDEQEKKAAKRWRKAISRSMFGHGRRSQREESQTEEVKN